MTPPDIPRWLRDGPPDATLTLVLAHGAGAPMDSPWMNAVAGGLGDLGIGVVRFEFPYMAARRSGERRPPDREPTLRRTWTTVVAELAPDPAARRQLAIGGKSMGGRIASMVADELAVGALVCLGYPFHPPGSPQKLRTAHLATLRTPTLIVQGERDPFGGRDEVAGYALARAIEVAWLPDGDHGFAPRKSSGRSEGDNLDAAIARVASFLATTLAPP